jgi:hypothetical protein
VWWKILKKLTLFEPFTSDIDIHVREALDNYFFHRLDPGSFTKACLANDLVGAAGRAHPINLSSLGYIGKWLQHNAPHGSWGSYEIVEAWISGNKYYQEFEKNHVWEILGDKNAISKF